MSEQNNENKDFDNHPTVNSVDQTFPNETKAWRRNERNWIGAATRQFQAYANLFETDFVKTICQLRMICNNLLYSKQKL